MTSRALRFLLPLLLAAASLHGEAHACTAVDLVAADGTVVAGRTMEWAFEMQWKLVTIPRGTAIVLDAPPALKLPATNVRTRHAMVGVAPGIIPGAVLLEGQNSAGLGFSANFLPGFTRYQKVTPEDGSHVSIVNFTSWALGMHATVAELRAALPTIKVWTDPSLPTGPSPPDLHFVFVDRSGAGLVVEYVDGELQMHENAAHVLTNAPPYGWHLVNLRNYLDLSTVGVESIRIGSVDVTELGQGGGTLGIPGDSTPPARFVLSAILRHHMTRPVNAEQAIQAVGHVLNTVDLPAGIAQSRQGGKLISDYTQWVAIKDLTHNRMRIADYDHRLTFVTLDLDALFALDAPTSVPVSGLPYARAGEAVRSLGGR